MVGGFVVAATAQRADVPEREPWKGKATARYVFVSAGGTVLNVARPAESVVDVPKLTKEVPTSRSSLIVRSGLIGRATTVSAACWPDLTAAGPVSCTDWAANLTARTGVLAADSPKSGSSPAARRPGVE